MITRRRMLALLVGVQSNRSAIGARLVARCAA
jgi:hypothetical protein